jgi:hypothetical protein
LGEIGGRIDLSALVLRRLKAASVEDLDDVFGLGPNGAFGNAQFPAQFPALLDPLLDADS